MADLDLPATPQVRQAARNGWLVRLAANPGFQSWAARTPLIRRFVRAEGEALFDVVAGFCHAQVLMALVQLELLDSLLEAPAQIDALSRRHEVPAHRLRVLLRAAAALNIVTLKGALVRLTPRGAALATVPGLRGMIAHHHVLYDDLKDPAAFFRGDTDPALADFWPYVFGAGAAEDPARAQRYSELMAESQSLVAADTLDLVDLADAATVLDVGGGTGAFLTALGARHVGPRLHLFDLPAVVPAAAARFAAAGLTSRVTITAGSFRDDPLPQEAAVITLVRVLYDHADDTVLALLRTIYRALPPGGRLVVSEPMAGDTRPERAGDAYFALYCMAMRTGRARQSSEIAELLRKAGFDVPAGVRSRRPFVTSVIEAVRPS